MTYVPNSVAKRVKSEKLDTPYWFGAIGRHEIDLSGPTSSGNARNDQWYERKAQRHQAAFGPDFCVCKTPLIQYRGIRLVRGF
jgi:hypothetical protein